MQSKKIQLLITDWEMPGLNGLQIIQKIRDAGLPYYVYIIMLTGKQEQHDIVDALNAGADDYITKPFGIRELLARIDAGARIVQLETKLRQANEEMERLANYDYLTGLLNRRAVYAAAATELERSKRTGKPVGFLFLDLDQFKEINDQYGHLKGDEALREVAETLKRNLRPYDVCGRWAGDKFAVILPETSLDDARRVAERIQACIAQIHLATENADIKINVSIGAYVLNDIGKLTDLDEIVAQADRALYCAKQLGGGQVQFALFTQATP